MHPDFQGIVFLYPKTKVLLPAGAAAQNHIGLNTPNACNAKPNDNSTMSAWLKPAAIFRSCVHQS